MTTLKNRLLLIENQKTQFINLRKKLCDYDVYPEYDVHEGGKTDKYDHLMDWVRVWANAGYKSVRRETVLENIKSYIKEKDVELIIMDYKICGSHDGYSGIDLATVIENNDRKLPVLFLSRIPANSKELEREQNVINKEHWIEKGYAGMNILEDHYFDKYVKTKISKLLQSSSNESKTATQKKLEELCDLNMFENEFHQLHALLKNTEKIGPEEEIFINHLYDMIKINFNPDDSIYSIRAYIKDYEKKQHHI
jgi:hypothetical protein